MSNRVLVTGGTGFIGSHLLERLVAAGYEVTALVRSLEKVRALDLSGGDKVRWICGHLHDAAALQEACMGQDVVVHSAAMATDWGTIREIMHHNVTGTEHLARAAVAAGVGRWIQISSTDHRGDAKGLQPGRWRSHHLERIPGEHGRRSRGKSTAMESFLPHRSRIWRNLGRKLQLDTRSQRLQW